MEFSTWSFKYVKPILREMKMSEGIESILWQLKYPSSVEEINQPLRSVRQDGKISF